MHQTASIEFAEIELRVVEGLKVGNAVLRELNEQTKIEDVERLMAETEEAQAYRDVRQPALMLRVRTRPRLTVDAFGPRMALHRKSRRCCPPSSPATTTRKSWPSSPRWTSR